MKIRLNVVVPLVNVVCLIAPLFHEIVRIWSVVHGFGFVFYLVQSKHEFVNAKAQAAVSKTI